MRYAWCFKYYYPCESFPRLQTNKIVSGLSNFNPWFLLLTIVSNDILIIRNLKLLSLGPSVVFALENGFDSLFNNPPFLCCNSYPQQHSIKTFSKSFKNRIEKSQPKYSTKQETEPQKPENASKQKTNKLTIPQNNSPVA